LRATSWKTIAPEEAGRGAEEPDDRTVDPLEEPEEENYKNDEDDGYDYRGEY
jgi:hypothetical protein